MPDANTENHWQNIYAKGTEDSRGWYQSILGVDAQYIEDNQNLAKKGFIDIGAGVSNLAIFVLKNITSDITILDISQNALNQSRAKLGAFPNGENVQFINTDIRKWQPTRHYGLWHDRAMFHFLGAESDQKRYLQTLNEALIPNGKFILSGFAPNGPEKCSGLAVNRLNPEKLQKLLGKNFILENETYDTHQTPSGSAQNYVHLLFCKPQ